ncbi:30S ribosome-binding factor RbfA [Rhodobacteraceae bacterium 2376]|uniref:Ribosome-binding factor A n=1 Tax=Rhabdonatronobacter sediminivivens TaxID=2743469 RepID=A0A7Z0HYS0_9RHOB|nr:30S ribosome-binding factor RbfA [Rhabdonatronobacter sediminivivens]NYS24735.1 30S ribosome-binding factor RbfA [Rhabdonatronobacter sediminivivens]
MSIRRHNAAKGPSQRQLRVAELIRRTLSDVLNRADVHDPELNRMSITVSEVRTSPDLKLATVFVMPLGGDNQEAALKALARNRPALRRAVGKELTLKFAPDLRFRLDETFDRMDDTRRIFADARVQRDVAAADEDGSIGGDEDR